MHRSRQQASMAANITKRETTQLREENYPVCETVLPKNQTCVWSRPDYQLQEVQGPEEHVNSRGGAVSKVPQ